MKVDQLIIRLAAALILGLTGLCLPSVALADFPPVTSFPNTGFYQARFLGDTQDIALIELAGSYDRDLADGGVNIEPRTVVAREFYRTHPDNYDFIVVFSNFEFDSKDALAFHIDVQNQVKGLGKPMSNNAAVFGSGGKLIGYIDMAALSRYVTNPYDAKFEDVLRVFAHEFLHQWAAKSHVLAADGSPSEDLLGKDAGHWSFLLDTGASVEYGNQWRDNGDGTFTSVAGSQFYSPLDLYLMGMYSKQEVPPFFLIDNPQVDKTRVPANGVTVSGTRRNLTIDDVIAADGPRMPDADHAQKEFRLGFVLLSRAGAAATDAQTAAVNSIRKAVETRIAVLTGGRALAHTYSESKSTGAVTAPNDPRAGDVRSGGANTLDGMTWLRGQQGADGYWRDNPFTAVRDTVVAFDTLNDFDGVAFTGRARTLAWLAAQSASNTDYLARRLRAVTGAGGAAGDDATRLLALQNGDGGWGVAPGYQSNPLDTALVLQALAPFEAGLGKGKLDPAVAYLAANQNTDGGWGNLAGGASRTAVSATVLQALAARTTPATLAPRAIAYLAGRQRADGGFGDSGSTVHDTANVVLALLSRNALANVRAADATAYVAASQHVDGSWDASVYSTALALRLLKSAGLFNWSANGLNATPGAPLDGQQVVLGATVANNGSATAPAGVARFYDGDPAAAGQQIGQDISLPALLAGDSMAVSVLWNTKDKPGAHQIVFVVDPDNLVQEASKGDNRAQASIKVAAAPAGAELQIDASAVTVSPARPSALPAVLSIAAPVANIGKADAGTVRVVLLEGEGKAATLIAEKSINLLARSQQVVNFSATLSRAGATVYTVVVDPDGLIAETDKSNNSAAVTVETSAALDLEVRAAEIGLAATPVYKGGDANFNVKLRNAGTLDSPPFKVRYSVSNGTTSVEVASRTLQLAAGAAADQQVRWLSEFSGNLSFKVELDPDGILSESSKSNNSASLAFVVSDASGANLSASFKELGVNPALALERQPLALSQVVRNTGTVAANNIEVGFYDGDPAAGKLIGTLQTIATLAPGAAATVGVTWAAYPDAQDHLIMVVVDPAAKQSEITRDDNTAFVVVSANSLPDLAVAAADMVFTPQSPKPGEAVSLSVALSNLGKQAAGNVVVRLYDGAPAQGGQPIGADQVIAQLDGLVTQNLVFSVPGQAASGTRVITVVLDPANAIVEQRKDNNSAQRTLTVQDGKLFVSNRYFSPNGDGVKDDTTLGFRLGTASDVTVNVLDKKDQVVRTYAGDDLKNITSGAVTWDGLNQRAEIAADGDYRLRVLAKDGSTLAESLVTLDNNRASVIDAIGTPFQRISPLSCGLLVRTPYFQAQPLIYTTDEEQLYFVADSDFPGMAFRESPNGAGLTQLTTAALPDAYDFKITPNGEKLALSHDNPSTQKTEWWVMDGDKTHAKKVFEAPLSTSYLNVDLTADGSFLIAFSDNKLLKIPTDGVSAATVLVDLAAIGSGEVNQAGFRMAPDRKHLFLVVARDSYSNNQGYLVDVATGQWHMLPAEISNIQSLINFMGVDSAIWSPDSKKVVLYAGAPVDDANEAAGYVGKYYVLDADANIVKLFQTSASKAAPNIYSIALSAPSWNSASSEFVFGHAVCIATVQTCSYYQNGLLNSNEQVMMRADLLSGKLEAIESTRKVSGEGQASQYTYLYVPNERRVLRTPIFWGYSPSPDIPSFELVELDGEQKITPLFKGTYAWEADAPAQPTQVSANYFAPSGRQLILSALNSKLAPQSCNYNTDYYNNTPARFGLSTLANLTAEVTAVRSASAGGLLVRATATDQNFSRYQIDYAPLATPTAWKTVAPSSDTPVIDQVVTTWVPPAFGNYLLRLTVQDQAGNQRQQSIRVSWTDTPSITDVYKDVEFISPNGDAVQDEMKLHYRVLEPVHLEFKVYGADGGVIRSMERDHITPGEEATFNWDGRDSQGVTVADGQYRLTLQDYEFFVTVDTTMPSLKLALPSAYGFILDSHQKKWVTYRSTLSWQVDDGNFADAVLARLPDAGAEWVEVGRYPVMPKNSSRTLGTGELVGNQYRMTVSDKAGNQVLATSPLVDEQLFLLSYANHGHNAAPSEATWQQAMTAPYGEADIVANLPQLEQITGAYPLRLKFAETVRKPLAKVILQFREIGAGEGALPLASLDGLGWNEVLVNNFVAPSSNGSDYVTLGAPAPDNFFEFLWDLKGVKADTDYMVRLKASDSAGTPFAAMTPYRFRFEPPVSQINIDSVSDNRPGDLQVAVLTTLPEPPKQIELLIASSDDPRFLAERSIDTVYAPPASYSHYLGQELLQNLDLRLCSPYVLRLKATLATGEVLYSPPAPLQPRCLGTNWIAKPETVQACNATPSGKLQFLLRPYANDGRRLTQLLLGQTGANGQEDILNNWTAVSDGAEYSFSVDTTGLADGAKTYFARLTNEDGKVVTNPIAVEIAHAPPIARITSLHEGQLVCGIPARDPRYPNDPSKLVSVVPVEATIDSGSKVSYALEFSRGADSTDWHPFSPSGVEKVRAGFSGLRQDYTREGDPSSPPFPCAYGDTKLCFDFHPIQWAQGPPFLAKEENFEGEAARSGELGRLGLVDEVDGDVSLRMRLFNASGAQVCTAPININVDTKVRVQPSSLDRALFSPLAAAPLEHVNVRVAPDEAVTLNIQVFPTTVNGDGKRVAGSVAKRTVAAGQTVIAGESVYEWDGTDDGRAQVADGWYVVRVSYMDGCGNTLVEDHEVEVDGSAPVLVVKTPTDGGAIGLLAPVTGSVRDAHFSAYQVQYQTASAPGTWVNLASGTNPTPGDVAVQDLALWNTLGLGGGAVLRITASDTVGNTSVQEIALTISARTDLLAYLEATPAAFSPNGDHKSDTVAVRYSLLSPAVATLDILRVGSDSVVKTLMQDQAVDAGAATRTWDGLNTAGTLEADGAFTARLTATSTGGVLVKQVESTSFALDTAGPKVLITYPKTDFVTPAGMATLSATDAHLDSYIAYFASNPSGNNWQIASQGGADAGAAQIIALEGLAEGKYGVRVVAKDTADNSTEVIKLFEIDATPPKVGLSAPLADSYLSAKKGPVEIAGAIVEKNLASYSLRYGQGAPSAAFAELAGASALPASATLKTWDVSSVPDGSYTLWLSATDLAGQTGQASVAVVVDNTAPVAQLNAAAGAGAGVMPVKLGDSIIGSASDSNLLDYKLEIAPGKQANATLWSALASGTTAVSNGVLAKWTALPTDGVQTLRLTVTDKAGNSSTALREVSIDSVPPAAPLGLAGTLENHQDAHLRWSANGEADLAGYALYRNGVRLNAALLSETAYLDAGLANGQYSYVVKAIDQAGLESAASAAVVLTVSSNALTAQIITPATGSVVSALVDIKGSASALADFKEFRLYAGGGAAPASWTLLRRSPLSAAVEVLANWNTLSVADGSLQTLKLEVEDTSGAIATSTTQVTVDNTAPAPATLLDGLVDGANVNLTWNASASSDVAGYLVYRDGNPVNSPGGIVGSLKPYLIADPAYLDAAVSDGAHEYWVAAVDQAENVSTPSNTVKLTVDNRAPHAVFVTPADRAEVGRSIALLATTVDTDVAMVQFQYNLNYSGPWSDIGAAVTAAPYALTWDGSALPNGAVFVRAVATDRSGHTDAAPDILTLQHGDREPTAPVPDLAAKVRGGDVTLSWSSPSSEVAYYELERVDADGTVTGGTVALAAAAGQLDPQLADGRYVYRVYTYDASSNRSLASNEVVVLVYTPEVVQPMTPTSAATVVLKGSTPRADKVVLSISSADGGGSADLAPAADGSFASAVLPLSMGENRYTLSQTDADGNVSKPAVLHVRRGIAPAAPTGVVVNHNADAATVAWNANSEADLFGYRVLQLGQDDSAVTDVYSYAQASSEAPENVEDGYGSFARYVQDNDETTYWQAAPARAVKGQWLELFYDSPVTFAKAEVHWVAQHVAADYDIEAWDGEVWVPLASVRGNEATTVATKLAQPYRSDRIRVKLLDAGTTAPRMAELFMYSLPIQSNTSLTVAGATVDQVFQVYAQNNDGLFSAAATSSPGENVPLADLSVSALTLAPATPAPGATVHLSAVLSNSGQATAANFELRLSATDADGNTTVLASEQVAQLQAGDTHSLAADWQPAVAGWYDIRVLADEAGVVAEVDKNNNSATRRVAVVGAQARVALNVTAPAKGAALQLDWLAPASAPPAGYRVERADSDGGPYQELATVAELAYLDSGLRNGTTYYYLVSALDQDGLAVGFSAVTAGTPRATLAPPPPVVLRPVMTGASTSVTAALLDISGVAAPASTVTLLRKDLVLAKATASSAITTLSVPLAQGQFDIAASADGNWLASSGNRSDIMDVRSGAVTLVTTGNYNSTALQLSRDGALLFYLAGPAGPYVYRGADHSTALLSDLVINDGQLALSQDDSQLALTASDAAGRSGLWLVTLASQEKRLLLESDASEFGAGMAWSPDGQYLAVLRGGAVQIVKTADGALVFTAAAGSANAAASSKGPSWSFDGTRLMYNFLDANGVWQIGEYALQTGQARSLDENPAGRTYPHWIGANDDYVDFEAGSNGNSGFVLHAYDGSIKEVLTQDYMNQAVTQVARSGDLFYSSYSQVTRVTPSGRFLFAQTRLNDGDNAFTLYAQDGDGNRSATTAPFHVNLVSNAPDLVAAASDIALLPAAPLAGQAARLTVSVRNAGNMDAANVDVSVSLRDPQGVVSTLSRTTIAALAAGAAQPIVLDWIPAGAGQYTVVLTLDAGATVAESNELNNVAVRTIDVAALALPSVGVTTDASQYGANAALAGTVTLANAGPQVSGTLQMRIEDGDGYLVEQLAPASVAALGFGQSASYKAAWNTGSVLAGSYRLAAQLLDTDGAKLASGTASFSIAQSRQVNATLVLDQAQYRQNQAVAINGTVALSAANANLDGASALVQVLNASGTVLYENTQALGSLLPGASAALQQSWNTVANPAGSYRVRLAVNAGGAALATAEAGFDVAVDAVAQVAGQLALNRATFANGDVLTANYKLQNSGNVALAAVPLTVTVLDPDTQAMVARAGASAELPLGGAAQGGLTLTLADWPLKTLQAVLSADVAGKTVVLQRVTLRVVDRLAPVLTVVTPAQAAQLSGAETALVVKAVDAASTVASAEYALDGAGWLPLALQSRIDGLYGVKLNGLADGAHQILLRATDAYSNMSEPLALNLVIDNTAPLIVVAGVLDGGQYPGSVTPVVAVTDAHLKSSAITLDGVVFVSGTAVSAGGGHTLLVSAEDQLGNKSSKMLAFTIGSAPTVSLLTPVNGAVLRAPVGVTGGASGGEGSIAKVEYQLDGGAWLAATLASGQYQATLEALVDGAHTVAVRATDAAGTVSTPVQSAFSVDGTAPVATITGVTDGAWYAVDVAATVAISDTHLKSSSISLNGAPYVSGTAIHADGNYVLTVQADDTVGNTLTVTRKFAIDATAPVITVAGVADGQHYTGAVTATVAVAEANLASSQILLDGVAYVSGTAISKAGTHVLAITAADLAGNKATRTLSFDIALAAPVATITAPANGAVVRAPFSVAGGATGADSSVAKVEYQLDGGIWLAATLANGQYLATVDTLADGAHTVAVRATDAAGTVSATVQSAFSVDGTAPLVTITGVTDGAWYAADVAATVAITDAHLKSSSISLNGVAYVSGAPIHADGSYVLTVQADDTAGNTLTVTRKFAIDATAPVITAGGVADGQHYTGAVTATVGVADANLASSQILLDGVAYVSGTAISKAGTHVLAITATDLAGNKTARTLTFDITLAAPDVVITAPANGAVLRAPVKLAGSASSAASSVAKVEYQLDGGAWLAAMLSGAQYQATVDALADGAHTVAVRATDAAGTVSTPVQSVFSVDGTAPVATITGVTDGAWYAVDVAAIVAISDAHLKSSSISLNGAPYVSGAAIHTDGSYVLTVQADDTVGNTLTVTRKFAIDATAPVITVAGVADGQHYTSAVTATVAVIEANLAASQVLLDGAAYVSGTAISKAGTHVLAITATDLAGNKAARTLSFDIASAAPVVSITSPAAAALLRTPFTISGKASSGGSSIAKVEYQVDGGAWLAASAVAGASGQYQASVATLADGNHQLLLRATDAAGQAGTSAAVGVVVDNTAPVITVTGVSNGATYTTAVTPVIAVKDAHQYSTVLTLDGLAYTAGQAISQASAHQLVITATDELGNKAETKLSFTIDCLLTGSISAAPKTVPTGDAVALAVKVSNPGVALGNVVYQVTITDAANKVVQQFSDSGALAAKGSFQKTYSWVTVGASGSVYKASLVVTPAGGAVAALGSDSFTLSAQRIALTGAVSVGVAQVEVGANAVLTQKVVNGGGAISGVKVDLTVTNSKTKAVVFQNSELVDLAPGQTWSADRGWKVDGPAGTAYSVALAATAGGKTFALGASSFSAIAPVPKVGFEYGAGYPQRVLVLSLCKRSASAGLGQCGVHPIVFDDTAKLARCDTDRANAVAQYLTALKVSYKVVTSEAAFASELRGGGYSAYWISGGGTKLHQPLQSELKAGLRLGEALLADGLHDIRSSDKALQELLGVNYLAKLNTGKAWDIATLGGLYPVDQFRVAGDALAVEVLPGAHAEALFQGVTPSLASGAASDCGADQGYRDDSVSSADLAGVCLPGDAGSPPRTAIVSGSFGGGRSLYFGFDWAGTFATQAGDARWLAMGRSSFDWLQPQPGDGAEALIAADVVSRASHLHNQGQEVVLLVKAELPPGATALAADPAATLQTRLSGDLVTWQFTLAAGEERDVSLRLRLPALKGSYALRYTVYSVVSGKTTLLSDNSDVLKVTDLAALAALAQQAVQALGVSGGRDALAKTETLSWLALAQLSGKLGANGLALRQIAMAQARLDGIDGVDLTAAQHALARMLRAVERRN